MKGKTAERQNGRTAERRNGGMKMSDKVLRSYALTLLRSYALIFRQFAFLICVVAVASCTTRSVEPTRQSRHTIDTLFQQQTIVLKTEMDKSCDSLYASVYKEAIDSIETARRIEIDSLVR